MSHFSKSIVLYQQLGFIRNGNSNGVLNAFSFFVNKLLDNFQFISDITHFLAKTSIYLGSRSKIIPLDENITKGTSSNNTLAGSGFRLNDGTIVNLTYE